MPSVFKVTTGTQSFVSVVAKVAPVLFPIMNTHSAYHSIESSTLTINLQILLKYFNGTANFARFSLLFAPSATVLLIILDFYLNEGALLSAKFVLTLSTFNSSLLNCHKLPEVSEYLSLYSIKLYIGISILVFSALSTKVSFISILHSLNGAQFLNATFVFALPPVTVIFPVTEIYASE